MKKRIVILGCTGSIGMNTLEVVSQNKEQFQVVGLSCKDKIDSVVKLISRFQPEAIAVGEGKKKMIEDKMGSFSNKPKVYEGLEGLDTLVSLPDLDLIICAISGADGIHSMLKAIQNKVSLAIANKEPLVMAGKIIQNEARKNGVTIFPMDSEHSAIFQCLKGNQKKDLYKIILTASGGPFLKTPLEKFPQIKWEEAKKHPNWNMGLKITIDSATMMNKALEVIETKWLFDVDLNQIDVVVHPSSIVHSLVHFKDGSCLAQLSYPDMKIPISYCLGMGERINSGVEPLPFQKSMSLDFLELDRQKFPFIDYIKRGFEIGEGIPAAMNAVNEELVQQFLKQKIRFYDIFLIFHEFMGKVESIMLSNSEKFLKQIDTIEDALQADAWGRNQIHKILN